MRNALGSLLLVYLAGCGADPQHGDGLARETVSGTVTLDGKPLSKAAIQFVPNDPNAPGGTSGEIEGGKFVIGSDRGPVAGPYRVIISSQMEVEVDATQPPGDPPKPRKDPIPARYNTQSDLSAEVKAGVPNTYDFPLVTK